MLESFGGGRGEARGILTGGPGIRSVAPALVQGIFKR